MSDTMYFNGSSFVGIDGSIAPDNKMISLIILFGVIVALLYANIDIAVMILAFYLIYKEVIN